MPKGYVSITDEEIIKAYQEGKFRRQICKRYNVGINRVRKVLRGVV